MPSSVAWNSQPLETWTERHARGDLIDLDGLPCHYVQRGSGRPVILIHGFFFDSNMWNKNIDALARHFTVFALDLWGFGYSTRTALDYGYRLYARQLELFMDAMALSKATLIGQSMGAGTIMQFARSHRERVEKMVLVNAAGLPNPLPIAGRISNLPMLGEAMYALRGNFIRRFILRTSFIHNGRLITDEFFDQLMGFHKVAGSSEVMLAVTRKGFFDTLEDEITELGAQAIPSLITWGSDERAISPKIGRELHDLLPGSRMQMFDEAGHCSNIDRADSFNAAVIEFVDEPLPT